VSEKKLNEFEVPLLQRANERRVCGLGHCVYISFVVIQKQSCHLNLIPISGPIKQRRFALDISLLSQVGNALVS
jgi:hypothetical protein